MGPGTWFSDFEGPPELRNTADGPGDVVFGLRGALEAHKKSQKARGHGFRTSRSLGSSPTQPTKVPFVNGVNQANHCTYLERPCATTHRIAKELTTCQS